VTQEELGRGGLCGVGGDRIVAMRIRFRARLFTGGGRRKSELVRKRDRPRRKKRWLGGEKGFGGEELVAYCL